MPSSMLQWSSLPNVLFGESFPFKLTGFPSEHKKKLLNGDLSPPPLPPGEEGIKNCSLMSSVSMTTSSFASSTEKLTTTTSSSVQGKKSPTKNNISTFHEKHNFTRSFSLTSTNSSETSALKLVSNDRSFSFDDALDEKDEDLKSDRNSYLEKLLDRGTDNYTEAGLHSVRVERKHNLVEKKEERSTAAVTLSNGSGYSQQKMASEERRLFTKRRVQEDISSSSSSLSSTTKMTFSAKGTSSSKTSQSAQNLHHIDISEMIQQGPCKTFPRPPLPKSSAQLTDQLSDDLDLLTTGVHSPEVDAAISRIGSKMAVFVEVLKSSSSRHEALATLDLMNDLIRRAWAVDTFGYDLGSSLCNILRNKGGLDIVIRNFSSEDEQIQFESARLLEQCLSTENRDYVVQNGLDQVIQVACICSISPDVEHMRIGTGILEHLFKHSEETCHEVIRLGGLRAILYVCRTCDIEARRHCAAALANLSLYGGPENQESMIEHKVPMWLFPLAFQNDDNIKYYACLAIAALVANKEIEAAVLRSGTLDLVEPFITSHNPEDFANSTVAHVHGQSRSWLHRLVPVLNSKREEARSLAAFHFAMEAGIKKKQGNTGIFKDIGAVDTLKKVASSPNAIASKYSALALQLVGEEVPHKLSQQVPLWTVEDVVEWVKQIGFTQYGPEFLNSRVDGDLLLQVNEGVLQQDIGIQNGILRRRFLRELNRLKRLADYSSCDTTSIGDLLQSLGSEFCQYTYQMLLSGVSRENLRFLTEEQLTKECGLDNSIHRLKVLQAIRGLTQQSDSGGEEELNPKSLDVFISYRRSNGSQLASLLKVHLQLRGFTVFIDVERLEAGKFDNNLVNSVRQARHFLLVLTANALDRCVNDTECKDWVHKEIVEALRSQCNIIPILDNFQWPDPESLPEDMRAVCYFNGVRWIHDYQDACVDKLERFMRGEMNVRSDGPLGRYLGMGPGTPGTPGSIPRSAPQYQRSSSFDSNKGSDKEHTNNGGH